jgi:acyl CoA:acetate/3-ketoacid CoA transferase alpha subunit
MGENADRVYAPVFVGRIRTLEFEPQGTLAERDHGAVAIPGFYTKTEARTVIGVDGKEHKDFTARPDGTRGEFARRWKVVLLPTCYYQSLKADETCGQPDVSQNRAQF